MSEQTTTAPAPDGAAGQSTSAPTTPTPDGGGDGQEVRNWEDAKRAIQQRDQARNELAQLRKERDEFKTKAETDGLAKAKAEGNLQGVIDAQQQKIDALTKENADAKAFAEQAGRRDRRRVIADAVLQAADPAHKDVLGHALVGLAEAGEIDLNAEDPASEASKALGKLTKRYPAYFRSDAATPGASPTGPSASIPAGASWFDLTDEQRARMTPEEFSKNFGRDRAAAQQRKGIWG